MTETMQTMRQVATMKGDATIQAKLLMRITCAKCGEPHDITITKKALKRIMKGFKTGGNGHG